MMHPPNASVSVFIVPSPPSASGCRSISAVGCTARIASAIMTAATSALSDDLNLSGATRTRIGNYDNTCELIMRAMPSSEPLIRMMQPEAR